MSPLPTVSAAVQAVAGDVLRRLTVGGLSKVTDMVTVLLNSFQLNASLSLSPLTPNVTVECDPWAAQFAASATLNPSDYPSD